MSNRVYKSYILIIIIIVCNGRSLTLQRSWSLAVTPSHCTAELTPLWFLSIVTRSLFYSVRRSWRLAVALNRSLWCVPPFVLWTVLQCWSPLQCLPNDCLDKGLRWGSSHWGGWIPVNWIFHRRELTESEYASSIVFMIGWSRVHLVIKAIHEQDFGAILGYWIYSVTRYHGFV